jgi:hypothetical protein
MDPRPLEELSYSKPKYDLQAPREKRWNKLSGIGMQSDYYSLRTAGRVDLARPSQFET